MSALGRSALELADLGYPVFPLVAHAKRPITARGFKDASRDRQQIISWWTARPDANIGVAAGSANIVVLDIDTKAGADPREILAGVDRDDAPVIGTGLAPERSERHPRSLTGRRGVQVYFRGAMASTPRLRIPGVEIKGAGGYVVAPPSIHPCGVEYVGQLPPVQELPPVPAWLAELVPVPEPVAPPRRRPPRLPSEDPLLGITAEEYIPRLTGREIGRDRKVRCPFHAGGRERTPSLHVYPGVGGWFCWPCNAGGDIYRFGELLYGLRARGASFLELRRRLTDELLGVTI